ncbi:unnamed protein product, partial [Pylaiella littoralis]
RRRGVSDEEIARCVAEIATFLNGIGFTALNQDPPAQAGDPTVPIGEEARARGRQELERDMRSFDWDDIGECESQYKNLVNACMRHTRCGAYCLKNGRCQFGFPKPRRTRLTLEAHRLTTPRRHAAERFAHGGGGGRGRRLRPLRQPAHRRPVAWLGLQRGLV